MENEKIIVSYQQNWNENGASYNQTVKLNRKLAEKVNEKLVKAKTDKNHVTLTSKTNAIFIHEIFEGVNFTKLTTMAIIKYELEKLGIDTKRILADRNTILVVNMMNFKGE